MVDLDSPPSGSPLPEPFIEALRQLARTPRLLVALDFDGTLAPEVDAPEHARALPDARAAVLRLAKMPDTRVALISGRALDSLIAVADPPDSVLLVGSHGIELRLDNPGDSVTLNTTELERVDVLGKVLTAVASSFDEVWIEEKPAGFALHTRLASEHDSRLAQLDARRETAAELDDLTIRSGKNVLEFSVRSATKGEAVEQLRTYTNATAAFYAGDDVTDEDAFAVLGGDDLSLKSGHGSTLANFRVAGPVEVAQAITLLADLREQ